MAVNVSRTISTNVGTSVYAQAYAQQIVDHFAQALEDNACLVQFPVGLYVEFDNFQNQIQDYINAAIDADPYVTTDDDEIDVESQVSEESKQITDELARNVLRSLSDDCFNCKIEKPKFDFSGLFSNLLADAQASLDQFKNLTKYNKASVCQYGFFLSYLCTPDLLKLIALILAALVRVLQKINLPRITISVFISGILAEIIKVLVKNISILARFALTPVLCILDSIQTIIDSLPTPENIRTTSGAELAKLGLSEYVEGNTGISDKIKEVRKAYIDRVKSAEGSVSAYAEQIFQPLQDTINNSVSSLQDSVTELSGLLNHFSCEPSRSGLSISEFLSNASELMALANLIRYVISFKAGKAAYDKLCNSTSGSYGSDNISSIDTDLTIENIGSIIANTIASDVDIITNSDGDPIGVVIKDDSSTNSDNLSFWNCNLKDFTESVTVEKIIERYIDETGSFNPEDAPELSPWIVNIVDDSDETRQTYDNNGTPVIPLDIDTDWTIPEHIRSVIETIDTYSPTTDNPLDNEVIFIPEELMEELSNRIKPRVDDTGALTYSDISKNNITDAFSGNKTNTTPDTGTNSIINGSVSLNSGSLNVSLECGTVDNILNILGDG